ncbi:hypothetical protein, partial [Actinocorallia aurantiaca]
AADLRARRAIRVFGRRRKRLAPQIRGPCAEFGISNDSSVVLDKFAIIIAGADRIPAFFGIPGSRAKAFGMRPLGGVPEGRKVERERTRE